LAQRTEGTPLTHIPLRRDGISADLFWVVFDLIDKRF
jgi:hypothetical protein